MDAATLRRTETIALVTGSLLLAASLLLISFAGMAAGQMNPVTRQAEVIGIDHMGSSITVRLLEAALGEQSDVVTLSFNEATGVIFCSDSGAVLGPERPATGSPSSMRRQYLRKPASRAALGQRVLRCEPRLRR